jgi:hypothetical protein
VIYLTDEVYFAIVAFINRGLTVCDFVWKMEERVFNQLPGLISKNQGH